MLQQVDAAACIFHCDVHIYLFSSLFWRHCVRLLANRPKILSVVCISDFFLCVCFLVAKAP